MDKLKVIGLVNNYNKIENLLNKIKECEDNIKDTKKFIENIIDIDFKTEICKHLSYGIDKFNLNKDKSDKLTYESISTSCSSISNNDTSINYKKTVSEYKNPEGKFNPFIDEWKFDSIDYDPDTNKYQIKVENIKGRKYIGAFNWIPDIYYTDWFEI